MSKYTSRDKAPTLSLALPVYRCYKLKTHTHIESCSQLSAHPVCIHIYLFAGNEEIIRRFHGKQTQRSTTATTIVELSLLVYHIQHTTHIRGRLFGSLHNLFVAKEHLQKFGFEPHASRRTSIAAIEHSALHSKLPCNCQRLNNAAHKMCQPREERAGDGGAAKLCLKKATEVIVFNLISDSSDGRSALNRADIDDWHCSPQCLKSKSFRCTRSAGRGVRETAASLAFGGF